MQAIPRVRDVEEDARLVTHQLRQPPAPRAHHGHPAGQRLDHHIAESVGPGRKDERIGAAIGGYQIRADQRAGEDRLRVAIAEFFPLRTVADDHFGSGHVELEEGLDILFDRDAANMQQNRPFPIEKPGARAGTEMLLIDTPRPDGQSFEAVLFQVAFHRARRHQRGGGG